MLLERAGGEGIGEEENTMTNWKYKIRLKHLITNNEDYKSYFIFPMLLS